MIDKAKAEDMNDLLTYIEDYDMPPPLPHYTLKNWNTDLPGWKSKGADRGLGCWSCKSERESWKLLLQGLAANKAVTTYVQTIALSPVEEGEGPKMEMTERCHD